MPLISIIVSVYNTESYVEKCLTSLLKQTFRDIEIIAVDDCSTDKSLDILRRYAAQDDRLKIFPQKQNTGVGVVRNFALSKVRGTYIMFCDSDDSYAPTMCERMKNTLEKTQSDMVMCDCFIEKEGVHGRNKSAQEYFYLNFKGEMILNAQNRFSFNRVLWNKIFKNNLIREYNIIFPPSREHDDVSFVAQYLIVCNKIYGLDEKLYRYVLRGNSIMGTFFTNPSKSNPWDQFLSWRYTVDFLIKNNKWSEYKDISIRFFFARLAWLQERFKWERFSKEDLRKMSSYLTGIPLCKSENILESQLYALQQGKAGFPDTVRASYTRYIAGFLPLKILISWNKKRIRFCGVELYKKDILANKTRLLGFIRWPR